jgi:hypothetical protein
MREGSRQGMRCGPRDETTLTGLGLAVVALGKFVLDAKVSLFDAGATYFTRAKAHRHAGWDLPKQHAKHTYREDDAD